MAHNRNVQCHSIMYFALFICLIANFINSEDVPYTLLNSPSTKEGTVIVLDGHDRYKRQANSSPSPATSQGGGTSAPPSGPVTTDAPTPSTAAPPPPTTSTAAPATAAPSTAAPNTVAPSTAAPNTAAPPTAAPNTAAPPTAAPGGTSTQPPTTTPQYNEIKDSNSHRYYKSRIISVTDHKPPYWVELYDTEEHKALSGSHRVAVSVNVAFTFPFYGHEVTKITIATGGFLYMSPFLHQWLTATQYIAPLMANFDTRLGNDSDIIYKDFTDSFVIEWRNIFLQDQNHTNPFYFQTVLHKNGTIVFSYKVVPLKVLEIEAGNHPVKVGLSDAFYIDSVVSGVQRRTIYEYHRVEINSTLITENTVVILEPLTTCNIAKDCETCVTQDDEFNCKWCGKLKRCSDGIDWKRQEWRNSGCENLGHEDVTLCTETTTPANVSTPPTTPKTPSTISPTTQTPTNTKTPSTISPPTTKTHSTISPTTLAPTTTKSQTPSTISPTTQTPTTQTPTTTTLKPTTQTPTTTTQKPGTLAPATTTRAPTTTKAPTTTPSTAESTSIRQSTVTPGCVSGSANCSILNAQNQRRGKGSSNGGAVAAVIVVIILLLALICGIGGWFYYAYSHPQSASGQWLIEHRPSQMKQKVAKMKFWKRSTPSGEKYAVESET